MDTKQCGRCEQHKQLTDFGPDRRTASGLKSICKQCDNEIHKDWYAKRRDEPFMVHRRRRASDASLKRFAEKKARGECYFCDRPAVRKTSRCAFHAELAKTSGKKSRDTVRHAAIFAYGNKCVCCGETEHLFLTIDHIDGGGSEHRRTLAKNGKRSGAGGLLYYWLARHGFPKGFQVLCYNCNCGRYRNGGICPHKMKES